MNGYIYNTTKNEREVLDSEKLRLIIKTEGNKTVIDGGKIMTNSITAKSISANSIYAEHISTDAIKTGHVSAGSIVSIHIKAEAILSTHIQSDTILARHIKADQINSNHIIANTILAKHIKANEIEAKHIKAGEVILPDEKYGGVYINSTGLNMINTSNHIALSAEKGLKIHNSLKGKTVFWANPTTGDIEMDVNKLTINSSDVYTKDNLNIGINNRIVYSQNGQSLNWFIGEYEVGHISLQNSERDGIKVKKFTKIKNSTSWVYYGISPSGIYKSLNMNPLEDWILTMKVYTEDIFNIKPLLCDGSGLNLNISFKSLETKKGWQILNFKGKTSGTVSPDKNNMIYISVGGLPSGIVLEHDWIMLSQGNTNIMNWSPSPDDIFNKEDVNSRFIGVQLSLEPDAITQTVTSSQTFAEWSDEAIGGKANQVDLNITNEELEKTKKEIVTTVDKVAELKTQADGIEGSVTTITKRVEGQEEHTERTKKFFTFDNDFLTIKKSDSLFNINITNEQMSFRNGNVETAFINGQKLFITEAQILKTIIVGNHQIQTDPATKQTIFKYIG